MNEFKIDVQLRWSDLDPNFHMRHSVYYDWGTLCRIDFLNRFDLTANRMQQLHIGPILFREECVFRKEIHSNDKVTVDLKLIKSRKNYSRWTIQHTIKKSEDLVAAIITIDGAWMNTIHRKLATPPAEVERAFNEMPHDENFQWMD